MEKSILKIPLRIYDVENGYRNSELYFAYPKSETGMWHELMLKAQNSGLRLAYSSEWYLARKLLENKHPEYEKDFIEGPSEWTGTVLDYDKEELIEGITLNPDKSIKNVKTKLGKKEGIILPHSSSYIKDMDDKYMPVISQLWGVKNPKRELIDYAYLWVDDSGFRPVVRGDWGWDRCDYGRVDADVNLDAAYWGFAARFVSDKKPKDIITKEKYDELMKELSGKTIFVE